MDAIGGEWNNRGVENDQSKAESMLIDLYDDTGRTARFQPLR